MMPIFSPVRCSVGFVFLRLLPHAFSYNILISSIYGEGSHFLLGASIGEGLVERGHNVTCLISRSFEHRVSDPRFRNLSFEIFDHHGRTTTEVRELFYNMNVMALQEGHNLITGMVEFIRSLADGCGDVLSDAALMKRLENNDAIVMDLTWICGLLIKERIEQNLNRTKNIKLVLVSPGPSQGKLQYVMGSPFNPAYQPEVLSGLGNRMGFFQRISNLITSAVFIGLTHFLVTPEFSRIAAKSGLDPEIVNLFNWHDKFDLTLLSTDFSTDFPFPLLPSFIPVGGLTASPAKQLDQDLEDFVQSSGDHGVIVFTLGTYFSAVAKLKPGFIEMFADTFRKLPQKVIWQLTDPPSDLELPSNIKILPWVPQNDLLGHPKTRVFMYHGGNNGFQEASFHGVPIAVIPLYADQFDVAARIVARGMGRKLDKFTMTADTIYETLTDLINDPKYMKVAKHVSATNRFKPMTARQRAAFWIDHVIKHGGDYLRSPAGELSFVVYHNLDVWGFLFLIFLLMLGVFFYMLRFCLRCCQRVIFGAHSKVKKD